MKQMPSIAVRLSAVLLTSTMLAIPAGATKTVPAPTIQEVSSMKLTATVTKNEAVQMTTIPEGDGATVAQFDIVVDVENAPQEDASQEEMRTTRETRKPKQPLL